jgi:3-dehydrosphinganine reductase
MPHRPRPTRPRAPAWASSHVLVTGGSSGIGRAFVRQVMDRRARVSVLALSDADLAETERELDRRGAGLAAVLAVDVSDRVAVAGAVAEATERLGPVDAVLTCAGIAHPGHFERLPDDVFRRTMEIDYFGTLYVLRATVPTMIRRRRGSAVAISSAAGLLGIFGYTPYAPPKFAVRGLMEALRCELHPYGIHVAVVCPPDTDTPQLAYENRFKPAETRAVSGTIRPLSADRVAASIVRGMERGDFLIVPDPQTRLMARTVGLMPGTYRRMMDRRIRRAQEAQTTRGTSATSSQTPRTSDATLMTSSAHMGPDPGRNR